MVASRLCAPVARADVGAGEPLGLRDLELDRVLDLVAVLRARAARTAGGSTA